MKIKANELRWGNYLEINGEAVEIRHIGSAWLNHHVLSDSYKSASRKTRIIEYSPIRPTEKWMIDLGFELNENDPKDGILNSFKKDSVVIEQSHSGLMYLRGRKDLCVLSIHQLQNLYYALEGKEL